MNFSRRLLTAPLIVALFLGVARVAIARTVVAHVTAGPDAAKETVLYNFDLRNFVDSPGNDLSQDRLGNLYGTALGHAEEAVVFMLRPPQSGQGTWTLAVVQHFYGFEIPPLTLTLSNGSLFGTTYGSGSGCNFGCGFIYELTPPVSGSQWTDQTIYTFKGVPDGGQSQGALLADGAGGFYGTASIGGKGSCGQYGCGTVFHLSPPNGSSSNWTEQTIYNFGGTIGDGSYPIGRLVQDANGTLYGVTEGGGRPGSGTVFALKPPAKNNPNWAERVLHEFKGGAGDGGSPEAGLLLGADGSLYGTTVQGGPASTSGGVVFQLHPPAQGHNSWSETVLHTFGRTSTDGYGPYGDLVSDGNGGIVGTCQFGGVGQVGIIFKLSPPTPQRASWKEHVVHTFGIVQYDGTRPTTGLLAGGHGVFYGNTSSGGLYGSGTVYSIKL